MYLNATTEGFGFHKASRFGPAGERPIQEWSPGRCVKITASPLTPGCNLEVIGSTSPKIRSIRVFDDLLISCFPEPPTSPKVNNNIAPWL
jgi:hypothetical protein